MSNPNLLIPVPDHTGKIVSKFIGFRNGPRYELTITDGYSGVLLPPAVVRDIIKALQAFLGELADEERTKREDSKP